MADRLHWQCEDTRALGRWLSWAGWLLFLVSLLLPAISVLDLNENSVFSGWQCAVIVMVGVLPILGSLSNAEWTLVGFALSNLLVLSAPLLFWMTKRCSNALRVVAALYLLSAVNATRWMWDGTDDLLIGYYAWVLSFGLLAVGCLLRSVPIRSLQTPATQLFAVRPRTLEELAAERELRDYSRGREDLG